MSSPTSLNSTQSSAAADLATQAAGTITTTPASTEVKQKIQNNLAPVSPRQTAHTVAPQPQTESSKVIQEKFDSQINQIRAQLDGVKDLKKHTATLSAELTTLQTTVSTLVRNRGLIGGQMRQINQELGTLKPGLSQSQIDSDPVIKSLTNTLIKLKKDMAEGKEESEASMVLIEAKTKELALCYIQKGELPDIEKAQKEFDQIQGSNTDKNTAADRLLIQQKVMQDIAQICSRASSTPKQLEQINKFIKALDSSDKKALIQECAHQCAKFQKLPLGISIQQEISALMLVMVTRGTIKAEVYANAAADNCLKKGIMPSKSEPLHGQIMNRMAQLCCEPQNPYGGEISRQMGGSGQTFFISIKNPETQEKQYLMVVKRVRGEPDQDLGDKSKLADGVHDYFSAGSCPLHEHITNNGYLSEKFDFRHSAYGKLSSAEFKEKDGLTPSTQDEFCLITDFIQGSVGSLEPIEAFKNNLGLRYEDLKAKVPSLTEDQIVLELNKARSKTVANAEKLGMKLPEACYKEITLEDLKGNAPLKKYPSLILPNDNKADMSVYQKRVSTSDLQKIAYYHLTHAECDPNSGNVMVVPDAKSGKVRFQPIDAGQSNPSQFPYKNRYAQPPFWIYQPGAEQKPDSEVIAAFKGMDIEAEAQRIISEYEKHGIPFTEESIDVFRAHAYFVKQAVVDFKMAPKQVYKNITLCETTYEKLKTAHKENPLPPKEFWAAYSAELKQQECIDPSVKK